MVFYSGHGDRDGAGAFYLLPHDVEPALLLATGVPGSQIKGIVQDITLALTEGLSGKAYVNGDEAIYSNELDAYVSERVKDLSNGEQHPVTVQPGTIRSFPLAKQ